MIRVSTLTSAVALIFVVSAAGQVTPAPAFQSGLAESISLPPSSWGLPRTAFHGFATFSSANGSLFGTTTSQALGSSGTHVDSADTFGVLTPSGGLATATFEFKLPVAQFGGYFAATTSGSDPTLITVQFQDASGTPIGADQEVSYFRPSQDGALEWHGWTVNPSATKVVIRCPNLLVLDALQAVALLQIHSITRQGSAFQLNFPTAAGISYSAQAATDFSSGIADWTGIGSVTGTGAEMSIVDPLPVGSRRFYRVYAY